MNLIESFIRTYVKQPEASCTQDQTGDRWHIRVPLPVFVTVTVSQREVMASKLNPRGFLRDVVSKLEAAVKAGVQQYEDGAEAPALRKRIDVLEWERSE